MVLAKVVIRSIWVFFFKALGALSGFALTFVLAARLGATESGVFFLAFAAMSFVSTLFRFGCDNVVIRFASIYKEEKKSTALAQTVFLPCKWVGGFSIFFALIIWAFKGWLTQRIPFDVGFNTFLVMSLAVPCYSLLILFEHYLKGIGQSVYSVLLSPILINVVTLSLVFLFGVDTAEGVSKSFLVSIVILFCLVGLFLWSESAPPDSSSLDYPVFLSACKKLLVVSVMSQMVLWSGQLIVGYYLEVKDVSVLAVSQRISMLVGFVIMAVNIVVAPMLSSLYAQGANHEFQRLARLSVAFSSVVGVPICIGLLLFPATILGLFGSEFSQGGLVLRVLAFGQLINVLTGSAGYVLTMSGYEADLRNAVVVSGSIALIFALILVPWVGLLGAAISTSLAVAVQNIMSVYFVRKRLRFNLFTISVTRLQ